MMSACRNTGSISLAEVRANAMSALREMARDEVAGGNDQLSYTVLVSDEEHCPVFLATLSLVELWQNR